MTLSYKTARKTKHTLNYWFDNCTATEEGQQHIEQLIENEREATVDMLLTDLSWVDYDNLQISEDCPFDYDEDIRFEFVNHHHAARSVGDTRDGFVFVGATYGIPEDIEDQADDDEYAYYYNGASYHEVWIKVEYYTGTIREDK